MNFLESCFLHVLIDSVPITRMERPLASHPMWPGFNSRTRRYMRVEFVVGSRLVSRVFLWVLWFLFLLDYQPLFGE